MADPDVVVSRALALGAEGADRETAVDELVRISEGRRELLESARDLFVTRLHRDSADYDATRALRLVNAALPRVERPTPTDS